MCGRGERIKRVVSRGRSLFVSSFYCLSKVDSLADCCRSLVVVVADTYHCTKSTAIGTTSGQPLK